MMLLEVECKLIGEFMAQYIDTKNILGKSCQREKFSRIKLFETQAFMEAVGYNSLSKIFGRKNSLKNFPLIFKKEIS